MCAGVAFPDRIGIGMDMFHLAFIFVLSVAVRENLAAFENCEKVTSVVNFDENRFLGIWYMYETNEPIQLTCIMYSYNKSPTSDSLMLTEDALGNTDKGHILVALDRDGTSSRYSEVAKIFALGIRLHWIMGTDYNRYAVIYACKDLAFFDYNPIYILTRKQIPDSATIIDAENVLKMNNMDISFDKINQTNCTFTRIH